jgi:hypothetical protein
MTTQRRARAYILLAVVAATIYLVFAAFNPPKIRGQNDELVAKRATVLTIYTVLVGSHLDKERIIMNRQRYSSIFHKDQVVKLFFQLQTKEQYASWTKVFDYERLAASADYIWFLDADAYIMSNKSVFDVIPDGCDLIIDADQNGVNAGSFILRSSAWSLEFMGRVYALRNDTSIPNIATWWENAVFHHLVKEIKDHLCVVSQKELNAYPETDAYKAGLSESKRPYFWKEGDLVIHSPGLGANYLSSFFARNNMTEF